MTSEECLDSPVHIVGGSCDNHTVVQIRREHIGFATPENFRRNSANAEPYS